MGWLLFVGLVGFVYYGTVMAITGNEKWPLLVLRDFVGYLRENGVWRD